MLQLRIIQAQVIAADDTRLLKLRLQLLCGNGSLDRKLIKERSVEDGLVARQSGNLSESIMCLLQTELAQFAKALLTDGCHVDSGTNSEQRLVRADIRRSAFTTDMLFARLQSQ